MGDLESQPVGLSNHIIQGKDCNHGPDLIWRGRVKVAHSLEDAQGLPGVRSLTGTNEGITVALTRGNARGVEEVQAFVVTEKILAVRRGEKQCISCACRLAQVVKALLVYG
jgi:hypothetical protein